MNLRTKASSGYAMAALLVAMTVMAVLLSVALPTWSHMIRREKEEELIFRGNQYARAFSMYQRKYGVPAPPNLDVLLKERFLRKKYKDPLSPNEDGEFQLLYAGLEAGPRGSGPGRSGAPCSSLVDKTSGPIRAVASRNTGQSIRVFNGKTRYNEWEFAAVQQTTQPGGAAGGRAGPPGSRGQSPGSPRSVNPNDPSGRNPGAPLGAPPGGSSGSGQVPGRGSPGAPPGTIR